MCIFVSMETESSETYTAFGEAYTIARVNLGWNGVRYRVTHAATGQPVGHYFGTRGYATHHARIHAQGGQRW